MTSSSDLEIPDHRVGIDARRLTGWRTVLAWVALSVAALAGSGAALISGRLAEHPTSGLLWLLAAVLIGGALLDTAGKMVWVAVVNRGAGQLRHDLLDVVLAQPLEVLSEQAVGEVLDRVDDDTNEVSNLLRMQLWGFGRLALGIVPMWIVAGLTWWPAWLLFPIFGAIAYFLAKPRLAPIATAKVKEEAAWSDHAAALEESIAGRDDLRTSLGQPFAIARLTRLSSIIHARMNDVLRLETRLLLLVGVALHGLLAVMVAAGVVLALHGHLSVASLVTLFMVTTGFVGALSQMSEQLPDIQAGLGAVMRLRQVMASVEEATGGENVPDGPLDVEFRHLNFRYDEGSFGLHDVSLRIPAGKTLAVVGRTGSGKSTLAALISRAMDPPERSLFIGGADIDELSLLSLRQAVGVVTQKTEILAGTLAQNIMLFEPANPGEVEGIVERLGLTDWVASLPEGVDTLLGPGGTALSAGEEQLLAFARLLARDVRIVILDEATARMDPLTEQRVVKAAGELLRGRTGVLIAHRLSTISRADFVAVMDAGRLVQFGTRRELAGESGRFRTLLEAAGNDLEAWESASPTQSEPISAYGAASLRRAGDVPHERVLAPVPSLAAGMKKALLTRPRWGLQSVGLFLGFTVMGATGALTGFAWGHLVSALTHHDRPWWWLTLMVIFIFGGPLMLASAIRRFPRWWIEVSLRARMKILIGQTADHRLDPVPAGEIVARAMDSDRYVRYADRVIDMVNGLIVAAMTAIFAGTPLAGLILLGVLAAAAGSAFIGRPIAGRSATKASVTRAHFGRVLTSVLESARTVKLAGRTPVVRAHLLDVDSGRVEAAIFEARIRAILDAVPGILVQTGVVLAWACMFWNVWGLATALLVANVLANFEWFGRVAGAIVTDAPGTRSWQVAASEFAGGGELLDLPRGVDLLTGAAPVPTTPARKPLEKLTLRELGARHDDGTIGVSGINLEVNRGELVLLVGRVGSGKSSLLRALAGLLDHDGGLEWNGEEVKDVEGFLRPRQVAYVAQIPRVFSGTFRDNVSLGHDRDFAGPVEAARLEADVASAGGPDALIGHRGVRLSGGQVQRLALARALASDAELLLADDVSSALDAATELELWKGLRARGATVIGATSKRSALEQADQVIVLDGGQIAARGTWRQLEDQWSDLAG